MIEILFALAMGFIISYFTLRYIDLRTNANEARSHYIQKFVEVVERLADDPDLSDEDFRSLQYYSKAITDPISFHLIMRSIQVVLMDEPFEPAKRRVGSETDDCYLEMFYLYVQAVSYSRPIMGVRLRALFSRLLEPRISDVSERRLERHIRDQFSYA